VSDYTKHELSREWVFEQIWLGDDDTQTGHKRFYAKLTPNAMVNVDVGKLEKCRDTMFYKIVKSLLQFSRTFCGIETFPEI
jgi:hypothetical protein